MKFLKVILITFFLSLIYQNSYSQIVVDARYVILQDHMSGEILYEKEADNKIYPASMTKIMTSLVVFDLLKKLIVINLGYQQALFLILML